MNAASPALRGLIRMGQRRLTRVPVTLRDEESWNDLNEGDDSWIALANALTPDELEALIRGLILYGRKTGRCHQGPFSPVMWMFRRFAMNWPEREGELGGWIVANRVNPYDPFGTAGDPSTTFEEFKERERIRLRAKLGGSFAIKPDVKSLPRKRQAKASLPATAKRAAGKGRK